MVLTVIVMFGAVGSASAADTLQSSSIDAHTGGPYYHTDFGSPTVIHVTGTAHFATYTVGDTVDVDCTLSPTAPGAQTSALAGTTGVPVASDGSFAADITLDSSSGLPGNACVLRALPAGTPTSFAPGYSPNDGIADVTPFTGPNVAIGEYYSQNVSSGPNANKQNNYVITGVGFSGQVFFGYQPTGLESAGDFGLTGLNAFAPETGQTNGAPDFSPDVAIWGGAGWFNDFVGAGASATFAGDPELQTEKVDPANGGNQGFKNSYTPSNVGNANDMLYSGSDSAPGFKPLTVTHSVDASTGVLTVVETDPLVQCVPPTGQPDPGPRGTTDPASSTNCPSFADTGVQLVRTITYDHDGVQLAMSDVYSSTDGLAHHLNLRYEHDVVDYNQYGYDAPVQYQVAWPNSSTQTTPSSYAASATEGPSGPGVHTIYIDQNGGARLGVSSGGSTASGATYDRGAVTFSAGDGQGADGVQFCNTACVNDGFQLKFLNRTVPAGGSLKFGLVYSVSPDANGLTPLVGDAVTRLKANPSITTTPSGNATVGSSVTDVAHLTGGSNFDNTGSLTFKLYGPNDATCTGTATMLGASPSTVNGNGDYTSASTTPSKAGSYHWTVSYNGDANNNPVAETSCSAEPITISKATPTISSTASSGGAVGSSVHDVAHLSALTSPDGTGSVSFKLYAASDPTCTGSPAPTSVSGTTPAAVSANGDYTSGNTTPAGPGTYHWIATFSGDANNSSVSTNCSDEPVTITNSAAKRTITVTKKLAPTSDPGRFDLKVNGKTVKAAAGDGGHGSALVDSGSNVTVSESPANTHPLSDYNTKIDCGAAGAGTGASRTLSNVKSDVSCTITNARRSALPLCRDRTPPTLRLAHGGISATRTVIDVHGTASDRGCKGVSGHTRSRAGAVHRVLISISQIVRGGCRFIDSHGHLGPRRSCRRHVVFQTAHGTTHWSRQLNGQFPTGVYAIRFRVYDTARNTGRPQPRRFRIH